MNKITIPKSWQPPKYQLGQRVSQGEIIGIEYRLPGTYRAYEFGTGWFYIVLPDDYSDCAETIKECDIKLPTLEYKQEVLETIETYRSRISTLTQQLEQ